MTFLCSILRDKYINRVLDLVKLRLLRSEFSAPPPPPPTQGNTLTPPTLFRTPPPFIKEYSLRGDFRVERQNGNVPRCALWHTSLSSPSSNSSSSSSFFPS